jgi:hypothetical protein
MVGSSQALGVIVRRSSTCPRPIPFGGGKMIQRPRDAESVPALSREEFLSLSRDVQFLPDGRPNMLAESWWISSAQQVCLVDFEKVVEGEEFLVSSDRCWRYLLFGDEQGESVIAAIDIIVQGEERRIRRTRVGALLQRTVDALRAADSFSEKRKIDCVVRFVELAAMQLDAVWLVKVKNDQEKFTSSFVIPAANHIGFKGYFPYPTRKFSRDLTAKAQRQREQRRVKSEEVRARFLKLNQ